MRFFVLIFLVLSSYLSAAQRPNVVVILSDDLGWGSVSCYGAAPDLVSTPNIDRLAREGRRFTDANSTSSVCSPTRYALMTGRYCWRTTLVSEVLGTTAPLHIETSRLTLASMLKKQGYACAAVGKWHLGYGDKEPCDFTKELKPGPLEIGFDYHFGVPANHGDLSGVYVENHWVYGLNKERPTSPSPPYVTMGQQKGKSIKTLALNAPKRVDENVMETLTDKLVSWIHQQSQERPFFVYFTPVAVHNPITPSKNTALKSKGGPFCDFIHDLDLSVGRVLEALDKKGLAENTIILFSSDNGGVNKPENTKLVQTEAQKAGLKPVGPFRGGKHDVWEGGFRVPYLLRWPGHIPAGTACDETISIVDTLATLASITSYALPEASEAAEDSHDVSQAWLGLPHEQPLRPDLIVHSADGNFAIRRGSLKWVEGTPADDIKPAAKKAHAAQFKRQLFDLKTDLTEATDISAPHEKEVAELEALLNRYRDGGYSRELPPIGTVARPQQPPLPPLVKAQPLDLADFQGASWSAQEGVWTGHADSKGAAFHGPLGLTDGVLECQVLLGEADRVSLRIHTAENAHNFRIVLARGLLDITKNPDRGQNPEEALNLVKTRLRFKAKEWQTLRLTFQGDHLTVEVAGTRTQVTHPVFKESKEELHLIAFDGKVAIRQAQISRADTL